MIMNVISPPIYNKPEYNKDASARSCSLKSQLNVLQSPADQMSAFKAEAAVFQSLAHQGIVSLQRKRISAGDYSEKTTLLHIFNI